MEDTIMTTPQGGWYAPSVWLITIAQGVAQVCSRVTITLFHNQAPLSAHVMLGFIPLESAALCALRGPIALAGEYQYSVHLAPTLPSRGPVSAVCVQSTVDPLCQEGEASDLASVLQDTLGWLLELPLATNALLVNTVLDMALKLSRVDQGRTRQDMESVTSQAVLSVVLGSSASQVDPLLAQYALVAWLEPFRLAWGPPGANSA